MGEKVGAFKSKEFQIYNRCDLSELKILRIGTSDSAFDVSPTKGVIARGASTDIFVRFEPRKPKIYFDTLVIQSDDPKYTITRFYLFGVGMKI